MRLRRMSGGGRSKVRGELERYLQAVAVPA
jgi:hypothetical protein